DPEVRDGVHAHRHVVLRDHLLRRDVQRDRAQVDAHHPVDDRDQEDQPRPLRLREQPAEPEDDSALVLAQHLDRRDRVQHEEEDDDDEDDERCGHGVILCTSRVKPFRASTETRSPVRSGSAERARQSSPRTNTWPSSRTTPSRPTICSGPTVTGIRRAARDLPIAIAQKPPSTAVTLTTSETDVW